MNLGLLLHEYMERVKEGQYIDAVPSIVQRKCYAVEAFIFCFSSSNMC